MKKTILLVGAATFLSINIAKSQSSFSKVHLSAFFSQDYILENDSSEKGYNSIGVAGDYHFKEALFTRVKVSYSKRNYSHSEVLLFGTDIMEGTSSTFIGSVEEKSLEYTQLLMYQFGQNKWHPFGGVGLTMQFPVSISGERKVLLGNGIVDELMPPDDQDWNRIIPGMAFEMGLSLDVSAKWKSWFSAGYKYYLNSNETVAGLVPNEQEFIGSGYRDVYLSFGIGYKL